MHSVDLRCSSTNTLINVLSLFVSQFSIILVKQLGQPCHCEFTHADITYLVPINIMTTLENSESIRRIAGGVGNSHG